MPVEQLNKSSKQKLLIVGNGAREHALAWKLQRTTRELYVTNPNPGIRQIANPFAVSPLDIDGIEREAIAQNIDFVVVGPEAPLAAGLVNKLEDQGIPTFGPTKEAAQLESSKWFAYQIMKEAGVPVPESNFFNRAQQAYEFIRTVDPRSIVIKADGLAAGKGVILPKTMLEAQQAIAIMMEQGLLGEAGRNIIIQERLKEREVSAMSLADGKHAILLPPTRDYKDLNGKNTGGMGAYGPLEDVDQHMQEKILKTIIQPIIDQMRAKGILYKGVLYPGLMITDEGPKVLEINARFGDPETQVLARLMRGDLFPALVATTNGTLASEHLIFTKGSAVNVVLASEGYPDAPQTGDMITGIQEAEEDREIVVFHAGTKMGENGIETAGGRVVSVTSYGPTQEIARESAYQAADKIKFRGQQRIEHIAV